MDFGLQKRGKYWHYAFTIDGARHRGSTKATTRKLAHDFAHHLYQKLYRQKHDIVETHVRIADFIREHLEVNENNLSGGWHRTKEWLLQKFLTYTTKEGLDYLEDVRLSHVEKYRSSLFKINKPKTVKNTMKVISSMFGHAVRLNKLESNPCEKLTPIRGIETNKKRFLSEKEIPKVLKHIKGTYLYEYVLAGIYTGMRRNELTNLTDTDSDYKRKLIYVRNKDGFRPKNRKERVVPMHKKLFQIFKRGAKGYCFTSNGKKINSRTVTGHFPKAMREIGLNDVTIHTLRHTFISHSLMNGVSPWEVGKWAGHSSVYITETYGHLCPDRREIDKLQI